MTLSPKVAVMFGGHSAEREVSLRSGQAVLDALIASGINAVAFDPAERPLADLHNMGIEQVLIMLHGRGGEDGSMQGALEQLQLPYTGSGVLGSALAMDKVRTKQVLQSVGLPTARYQVVHKASYQPGEFDSLVDELGTIMVKPALEGSSIGMSKVSDAAQLGQAIESAFEYDEQVLLEQFISGKEYTVSVLQGKALPSIRMCTPRDFYDYQAKYQSDSTEYFCPSGADEQLEAKLGKLAEQAFFAVAASGWGRVDFMYSEQGEPFILEVNTVPGMTSKSLVPMAAKTAGIPFAQLCELILQTAGLNK